MSRRTLTLLAVPLALLLPVVVAVWRAGASKPLPPKTQPPKTLALADVPPAFMETARRELPEVDFDEVWMKQDGTLEIRGKAKNGKIREVEIRPDGTVEEIE